MKRLYILAALVLGTSPMFSAVGTHNFVIKAGGGLAASVVEPLKGTQASLALRKGSFVGGVIAVDLGYQFFDTKGSLVQGVDTLIGFGMNFDCAISLHGQKLPSNLKFRIDRPYGYISSTYSVGHQFNNAKLMFDILGINLAIGNRTAVSSTFINGRNVESTADLGGAFGFGINLPIGTQYIMNNGFVVGFRHSLNFLFPAYNNKNGQNFLNEKVGNKVSRSVNYINYNLIVSFGYMFGK